MILVRFLCPLNSKANTTIVHRDESESKNTHKGLTPTTKTSNKQTRKNIKRTFVRIERVKKKISISA